MPSTRKARAKASSSTLPPTARKSPPPTPTLQANDGKDKPANDRKDKPTPFANDPIRGRPLRVSKVDIESLKETDHLMTTLIDYVIQRVAPSDLPDHVLIGSSNALSYFEVMNQKKLDSPTSGDIETVPALRRKYQFYSLSKYQFMAVNCSDRHFMVIRVDFDVS